MVWLIILFKNLKDKCKNIEKEYFISTIGPAVWSNKNDIFGDYFGCQTKR